MNQELDLTKILKDVPVETKFYSPVYGELSFIGINMDSCYPIGFMDKRDMYRCFTKEGKYFISYDDTECTIFPSKENRDWSTFNK